MQWACLECHHTSRTTAPGVTCEVCGSNMLALDFGTLRFVSEELHVRHFVKIEERQEQAEFLARMN